MTVIRQKERERGKNRDRQIDKKNKTERREKIRLVGFLLSAPFPKARKKRMVVKGDV